jgi:AAA15 family ATPase/GTPase
MSKNSLSEFVFDTNNNNTGIAFGEDYSIQGEGSITNVLNGLGDFNIFVGANNSGKSRILRAIYRQNDLVTKKDQHNISLFLSQLSELIKRTVHAPGQFKKTTEFIQTFERETQADFWYFNPEIISGLKNSISEIEQHFNQNPTFFPGNGSPTFVGEVKSLIEKNNENLSSVFNSREFHKLYGNFA